MVDAVVPAAAPNPDPAPVDPANPAPVPASDPAKPVDPPKPAAAAPVDPPKNWYDEQWREKLAGGDPDKAKWLDRHTQLENVVNHVWDQNNKWKSGAYKPALTKDATPEDIAAYRKAWGVPEKVEKPEDYGVSWGDYKPTDADNASLNSFLQAAHASHMPPENVKAAFGWWQAEQAKVQQQLYDAAVNQTIANKAEIKALFGKDYDTNVRLGNVDLVSTLGPDDAKLLPALTLDDGTKLGDHPLFVRYIATKGRAGADDGTLAQAEFTQSGKSIADQYNDALNLKFTDEKRYHSPEHQKLLTRLSQAMAARKAA